MSANTIDNALSFMPTAEKAGRPGLIMRILSAITTGFAAMQHYEQLTARGMSASEAAARVHAEFYRD